MIESICFSGYSLSSLANIRRDRTSPQDALEMNKCLTHCLFVSSSYPSAILAETEMAARSIWFFSENVLQFSNKMKTSLASLIDSCHTIRSSKVSELDMVVVSFAKTNRYPSNPQIFSFSGFACFTDFTGFTPLTN